MGLERLYEVFDDVIGLSTTFYFVLATMSILLATYQYSLGHYKASGGFLFIGALLFVGFALILYKSKDMPLMNDLIYIEHYNPEDGFLVIKPVDKHSEKWKQFKKDFTMFFEKYLSLGGYKDYLYHEVSKADKDKVIYAKMMLLLPSTNLFETYDKVILTIGAMYRHRDDLTIRIKPHPTKKEEVAKEDG